MAVAGQIAVPSPLKRRKKYRVSGFCSGGSRVVLSSGASGGPVASVAHPGIGFRPPTWRWPATYRPGLRSAAVDIIDLRLLPKIVFLGSEDAAEALSSEPLRNKTKEIAVVAPGHGTDRLLEIDRRNARPIGSVMFRPITDAQFFPCRRKYRDENAFAIAAEGGGIENLLVFAATFLFAARAERLSSCSEVFRVSSAPDFRPPPRPQSRGCPG